ncbi:endonuclease NucS domain-containing protein [Rhizobium sp.]|uniref:endonuclease NucS domain-containing protein n=1 Tax=Rhizobium sp. TaxID=391 RepID=UPI002EE12390
MVQRHSVVVPREDGGVEVYPLKEWLRRHPEYVPAGYDATRSTSHQLRGLLLRQPGWTMEEMPTEVRMIFPGVSGDVAIVNDVLGQVGEAGSDDENNSPYFSLEYQLRDFLAANINSINFGERKLSLYVDPTGRDGIEYPSAVGPIDILAVDAQGSFYVFELKRAASTDRALGQITRYMGWIKTTIGKDKDVYGVIISKAVGDNLKYARTVVPNIFLYEYSVSFSLKETHDLISRN